MQIIGQVHSGNVEELIASVIFGVLVPLLAVRLKRVLAEPARKPDLRDGVGDDVASLIGDLGDVDLLVVVSLCHSKFH